MSAVIREKITCKLVVLSVFLVICTQVANADDATVSKKLEVKIYYEALCPDSIRFIRDQFFPSMSQNGRLNFTDLKLVPYGHVVFYNDTITKQKVLRCQHGRNECELNAQQACIIENNSERETFDMITCMMRGYNQKIDKCASQFGVNVDAAKRCKQTRSLADILEKHGQDTYSLNPSFVPAITIDGVFNWNEQDEILQNFDAFFCRKFEIKFNETLTGC